MAASTKLLPKVLPMASSAISEVLPGLATRALSSLGSFGWTKYWDRATKLVVSWFRKIRSHHWLRTSIFCEQNKNVILDALQVGNDVVIKPTRAQYGNEIYLMLASIGLPLVLMFWQEKDYTLTIADHKDHYQFMCLTHQTEELF